MLLFSISTFDFIFAFISKFLYFSCPIPLLDIVHGNYKCSWLFFLKKKKRNPHFIRKNPLAHLKGLTTLFS